MDYRKARGKRTLQEVADAVGCSISTLSRIERGKRTPHEALRRALAAWVKRHKK